jgi:ribulose-5-phosphate 4-epimerase/fuculose-1-phosphate aldolase
LVIEEGYIKFKAQWTDKIPLEKSSIEVLNYFRQVMYDHQLIGAYKNGFGYGNISQRIKNSNQFIISGSKTGNVKALDETHYSAVTQVEVEKNTLYCKGATIASSESMSHAVIYKSLDWVNGVIHIHHLGLWKKLLHQIPTTDKSALYGSPEMAYAIQDLIKNTTLPQQKIFIMEGHEEGIFAFGGDLQEATNVILGYFS